MSKSGTHACNYLLTVDMEMEPVAGYEFANWQKGYGDFHLAPDFRTLRQASWLDRTAVVLCDLQSEHDARADRTVRPARCYSSRSTRPPSSDYDVMAASELEYYFFRNSYRDAAAAEYRNLEPAGWYLEDYHALQGTREEDYNGLLRRHLKQSGIAVESTKGEWGKGQHELNVEYTDVLAMADNHTFFKQCCKEVADQLGVSVTFMAKLSEKQAGLELPRALEPVAGRQERVRRPTAVGGGRRSGRHRMVGSLPQVSGRLAGARAGGDGLLCPECEFV